MIVCLNIYGLFCNLFLINYSHKVIHLLNIFQAPFKPEVSDSTKEEAEYHKTCGNEFMKSQNNDKAIESYTKYVLERSLKCGWIKLKDLIFMIFLLLNTYKFINFIVHTLTVTVII